MRETLPDMDLCKILWDFCVICLNAPYDTQCETDTETQVKQTSSNQGLILFNSNFANGVPVPNNKATQLQLVCQVGVFFLSTSFEFKSCLDRWHLDN